MTSAKAVKAEKVVRVSKSAKVEQAEKLTWKPRMKKADLENLVNLKDLVHFSEYVRHWADSEGDGAKFNRMTDEEFDTSLGYTKGRLTTARQKLESQTGSLLMDLHMLENGKAKYVNGRPILAKSLAAARLGSKKNGTKATDDMRMAGEMWGALGSYIYDLIEATQKAMFEYDWTEFLEARREGASKIKTAEDWIAFMAERRSENLALESGAVLLEAAEEYSEEELEAIDAEEQAKAEQAERERQEKAENDEINAYYDLVAQEAQSPMERIGISHRPRPGSKLPVYEHLEDED